MGSNNAAARIARDKGSEKEGNLKLLDSSRWSLVLGRFIVLASVVVFSSPSGQKQLSVYSRAANYSVAVVERNGTDYLGLLELLEPLGTVTARQNGDHWKLRYNDVESEFVTGQARTRIRGSDLNLPASFLLENGRGLVPILGLGTLLPQILGGPITLNLFGRRLFIGDVAIHFTAVVVKTEPPKLVMNFGNPVNPMIATEPGKLEMIFTHDPVVAPGSQTLTFDSKAIPSATFEESNGMAKFLVTTSVPAMASFSNDGRTITVTPASISVLPAHAPPPTPPAAPTTAPPVVASREPGAPVRQHVFVVIDPAHGGDERGAALTDQLQEKDVTLAFAQRLRELFGVRGLSAWLERDGDLTLSLDQRAAMSNASGAALYIAVHASSEGNGVRLYTALLPSGGPNQGWFLDWDTAQTAFEGLSRITAASVATGLESKQVSVRNLSAPLRPLNNVVTAAFAIEIGPESDDVSQLSSPEYQEKLAEAVVSGVADVHDQLEARRK
jgi:N-acetylmuramoyl-L-alanine amidase